jgi:cyclohexyl-isocyanide hydratase
MRHIALVMYPQFTALDLLGPHHMLSLQLDVKVHLVAQTEQPVTSDMGLTVVPSATFETCPDPVDVVVVPGGTGGTVLAMQNAALLAFLRQRAATATWMCSVCTGSLVLGAAGLLQGRRATSHWVALDELAHYGATPVAERVVEDGPIVTGGGVTAGIDFGLALLAKMTSIEHARKAQLMSEYDPAPPFDAGSPTRAGQALTAQTRALFAPFLAKLEAVRLPRPG